ncbi:thioredoxin domain-containing protein [uncultured Corynebacterium sp.]|uniref:DsbA family protein n=1 Tax=uncultured Corynebacterium sp. TaxID=159447 RepID=UPI002600F00C|nr:thioredoxin domain-containing protein [uncultured Corynebacterium sp.]
MSQKIKAPNASKGGNGFLWGIIAILVIAAVAIGFIVYNNQQHKVDNITLPDDTVDVKMTTDEAAVTLEPKNAGDDVPTVEVFEDFSCHYCAQLESASSGDLKKALEDGKVKVKFNFLNFLDRGDESGPSTRGAAVAWAVAKAGDVDAFWNIHRLMMDEQSTVTRQWGWDDLANAAEKIGVNGDVVDKIRDESVKDEGLKVAQKNDKEIEKREGDVSSPLLYKNGKRFDPPSNPDQTLSSWVPVALEGK